MKIKAGLFIEEKTWREIKIAAIKKGQSISDFIVSLFIRYRVGGDLRADGKPANPPGSPGDQENRD